VSTHDATIEVVPYTVTPHPVTGIANPKFGIWLFLASEVMLFGALFSTYVLLRTGGSPDWPKHGSDVLNVWLAMLNTFILITSSVTMVMAWASCKMDDLGGFRKYMGATILLALGFMVVKAFEYGSKFHHEPPIQPATSTFFATYFTLTGLHGLHVLGGIIVNTYLLLISGRWFHGPRKEMFTNRIECAGLYWHFVDLVWIFLFPVLYLL